MTIKNTIPFLFEKQVEQFPNHVAAVCGTQSLTYSELNKKANQLAYYLHKLGLKADTPVALCLERSFDFLITILAILKAGGAYLPIDPSQPEERLLFLLKDSQAPILITNSALKNKLSPFTGALILLDKDNKNISKHPASNLDLESAAEHLAYVIYTSGSTGTPKGVLIEHRSVVNYSQWFADYTRCKLQQRIDFSSNPIFDMAISTTIVPLMLGLTSVICHDPVKKDITNYVHYLAKSRISIIKLTPSYFKVLLQEVKNNFIALPHLKSIILGGENLPAAECKAWLSLYPEHVLFNEYGPTEATVAVSTYKLCSRNLNAVDLNVPIGKAGTQMSCVILDANNTPVPDGEAGELFIGGICLARGYLNQPELTERQFIKDPFNTQNNARLYKTGDLCKKRTDGVIEYLGRIDDQVKIRGFRVEPAEIEKKLATHPAIKAVAVLAQKDAFEEQRLVAYYILEENQSTNDSQIRQYLQKHVPDYMIPTFFVTINSFPLTANGKLDKAALPIPLFSMSQNYVEPTTALEKKLAKIWSEELGVELVGIYDDFFDLGGHSLSAARIVSKINNVLGKNISLLAFYQATNIAKLIPVIKKTKKINKKKLSLNKPEYHQIIDTPLSDFQFLLWMSNTFEPRAKKLNIVTRKRVQGRLNKTALDFAFKAILKKHEALIYRVLKFQPMQQVQKNLSFRLNEQNIEALSEEKKEAKLQTALTQLINFHPWPKDAPLIIANLFYLPQDETELQICLPHLISDDDCVEILFSDLSQFYLSYTDTPNLDEFKTDTHYKEYVFNERYSMEMHLEKDISFWEDYLKDSSLFTFPQEYVVSNMKAQKLSYSTYSIIPEQALDNLKYFCEQNHISINNALCAAVALALRNCCNNYKSETPYTFMNIVQSTRDNPIYDNTIGCFLRIEPIKVTLDNTATLSALSKQIRQSTIETSNYQHCSNLLKLSAVSNFRPKQKTIESFFIKLLVPIYTRILKIPPIYRKILQRCASRIAGFKRNDKFLINLNIRSNFIADPSKTLDLFGLSTKQTNNHHDDLLAIDYIFEVCFLRDDNNQVHYLVISANLEPKFRELIAKEVFQIMNTVASENKNRQTTLDHEDVEQLL